MAHPPGGLGVRTRESPPHIQSVRFDRSEAGLDGGASSYRNVYLVGDGWILPWRALGRSSRSLGRARPRFRSSFASVIGSRREVGSWLKTEAMRSSFGPFLASRTSAVPCRKRRRRNGC